MYIIFEFYKYKYYRDNLKERQITIMISYVQILMCGISKCTIYKTLRFKNNIMKRTVICKRRLACSYPKLIRIFQFNQPTADVIEVVIIITQTNTWTDENNDSFGNEIIYILTSLNTELSEYIGNVAVVPMLF